MNNNLAPITLQNDETFVENIQTKTTVYTMFFIYGIACIVISIIVMYVLKTFVGVDDGFSDDLGNLPKIAFYFAIALCLPGIVEMIYFGLRLKKTQGTKYFLTSKRLYVKLSKNEEYQAFSKDDIKSVSYKKELFSETPLNFGLLLELNNGEILHLSSLKEAEKTLLYIQSKL